MNSTDGRPRNLARVSKPRPAASNAPNEFGAIDWLRRDALTPRDARQPCPIGVSPMNIRR